MKINSHGLCAHLLVSLLLVGLISTSHAFPLFTLEDITPEPYVGFLDSTSAYDASTELFTASLGAGFGTVPGGMGVDFSGPGMGLTASINNAGEFSGGAVSWFGGSADLGIADGTLLFSGTISDFAYGIPGGASQFQFVIDTGFSNDLLGFGPRAGLTLYHYPADPELPLSEWFQTSFNGSPWTHEDMYNLRVPEPSSLLLMGIGLAGLGFVRRKKKA